MYCIRADARTTSRNVRGRGAGEPACAVIRSRISRAPASTNGEDRDAGAISSPPALSGRGSLYVSADPRTVWSNIPEAYEASLRREHRKKARFGPIAVARAWASLGKITEALGELCPNHPHISRYRR
jgi:hypothetical protein